MFNTLIMKFGGASVATPQQFSQIADLIIEKRKEFSRIVVVISAMQGTTNQLIELAHQVNDEPPQREYDMLISVGERISMSLLAMALCKKNQAAISFTGSQSGIITCSSHTEAHIVNVRPQRIEKSLEEGKIVIVAGFQGVSHDKEITTLGRGGSDTTAVALGLALQAKEVIFFKDVPGFFDQDPKLFSTSICYSHLTYQAALDIVIKQKAKILHPRAIQLAYKNGLPLYIRSFIPSDQKYEGSVILETEQKRSEIPIYERSETS